jgi:hypothetical protein
MPAGIKSLCTEADYDAITKAENPPPTLLHKRLIMEPMRAAIMRAKDEQVRAKRGRK